MLDDSGVRVKYELNLVSNLSVTAFVSKDDKMLAHSHCGAAHSLGTVINQAKTPTTSILI